MDGAKHPSQDLATWRLIATRPRSHHDRIETYIQDLPGAETGPSIKPVIISELVDLDPLPIVGRRDRQCHCTGTGRGGSRPGQLCASAPARGEPQRSGKNPGFFQRKFFFF